MTLARKRFDTHVHFINSQLTYPWLENLPALQKNFGPQELNADIPTSLDKIGFVQCECDARQALQEVAWVSTLAKTDKRIQSIVAYADFSQEAHDYLLELKKYPLVKGVRDLIEPEKDPNFCLTPIFIKNVQALAKYNLSFDICIKPHQFTAVIELVKQCPDTQFILDHMGKPQIGDPNFEVWKAHISEVAKFPNVACKLSGLLTEAGPHCEAKDLQPYISHVRKEFVNRLMFGSDWPVVNLAGDYKRWMAILDEVLKDCSQEELDNIFYKQAERIYQVNSSPLIKGRIPKANLELTKLALGGAQFGNLFEPMSDTEAYRLFQAAWEGGVRVFDTAPLYGGGLSEERIGKFLKPYPRDEYILSTKAGRLLIPDSTPNKKDDIFVNANPCSVKFDYTYKGIMASVKSSLGRLNTHYIDILHLHDLGKVTHGEQHGAMMDSFFAKDENGKSGYDALIELRNNGTIKAIGIGANEWEVCLELMEKTPNDFLDCIMLAGRYTLFEQGGLEKFFPACRERNITVMIAGPFNSGLLSNQEKNARYNYAPATDEIITRMKKLSDTCKEYDVELRHAALQFLLLNKKDICTIVSGMRTEEEVIRNIKNLREPVPTELWEELVTRKLVAKSAIFPESTLRTFSKFAHTPQFTPTMDNTKPTGSFKI